MNGTCPTASKGDGGPVNQPTRIAKAQQRAGGEDDDQRSEKADMGKEEDMKTLMEEAGKVLRSMQSSPGGGSSASASLDDSEAKIRSLQRQLDELKATTMKVLRLARIQPCENFLGLVDSGAAHCA